jgi:hypothetical protein
MKQKLIMASILLTATLSTSVQANWFQDIIDAITREGEIGNVWLNKINSLQGDMLASQKDIEKLMNELNHDFVSHSGWGSYQSQDYQSYGLGADNWLGAMQMANSGGGSGALGKILDDLHTQFPMDSNAFNQGVSDKVSQKYYSLQSQTALVARAASELDYNKIHDQIQYQQMLQNQIEKTSDLKSAIDLNNRIQVEANLINLGILRQSALSNQQYAISEQASVNSALQNSKFLTKE